MRKDPRKANYQGYDRDLGTGRGEHRGDLTIIETAASQSCGAGKSGGGWSVAGGGYNRCPCGQHFTPGEEVGSGRKNRGL